jgi:hypothetical protein
MPEDVLRNSHVFGAVHRSHRERATEVVRMEQRIDSGFFQELVPLAVDDVFRQLPACNAIDQRFVRVGGRWRECEKALEFVGGGEFVGFAALGWEFDCAFGGVEVDRREALRLGEAEAVAGGDCEPTGHPTFCVVRECLEFGDGGDCCARSRCANFWQAVNQHATCAAVGQVAKELLQIFSPHVDRGAGVLAFSPRLDELAADVGGELVEREACCDAHEIAHRHPAGAVCFLRFAPRLGELFGTREAGAFFDAATASRMRRW